MTSSPRTRRAPRTVLTSHQNVSLPRPLTRRRQSGDFPVHEDPGPQSLPSPAWGCRVRLAHADPLVLARGSLGDTRAHGFSTAWTTLHRPPGCGRMGPTGSRALGSYSRTASPCPRGSNPNTPQTLTPFTPSPASSEQSDPLLMAHRAVRNDTEQGTGGLTLGLGDLSGAGEGEPLAPGDCGSGSRPPVHPRSRA